MRCSQPQLAFPIPRRSVKPARFCRSKNGVTNAQATKAAVRGAVLRKRAKHAEKETRRKIGASLLASVFSGFFFDIDCRVNHAANFQTKTQVLCYFLDARK